MPPRNYFRKRFWKKPKTITVLSQSSLNAIVSSIPLPIQPRSPVISFPDDEEYSTGTRSVNIFFPDEKGDIVEEILFPGDIVPSDIIRSASIDIGVKTFTVYFEEFDRKKLQNLTIRDNILDKVLLNGRRIGTIQCDFKPTNLMDLFNKLHNFLLDNKKKFDYCDFIGIELQISDATLNQKIEQQTYAFFIQQYGIAKCVFSYPSKRKTERLGAPKETKGKKNYRLRKQWCLKKAISIFKDRKDIKGVISLCKQGKTDDISDCVCQLQAIKLDIFVSRRL